MLDLCPELLAARCVGHDLRSGVFLLEELGEARKGVLERGGFKDDQLPALLCGSQRDADGQNENEGERGKEHVRDRSRRLPVSFSWILGPSLSHGSQSLRAFETSLFAHR